MGVKGYPTLKIVKPGKKHPVIQDYNGPREAKGIVEAVIATIPNHVKKVTDKDLDSFLEEGNSTAKAILFTEKGTTSALLKALAVDFLGSIQVAQIRSKEKAAVERFGITTFPTVILLPGGEAEGLVYGGEIKKAGLLDFFSQVAAPNPDPAPAKVKMPKKKNDTKAAKKAQKTFESASSSHASTEKPAPTAADETIENPDLPTESPNPIVDYDAPVLVQEVAKPLLTLQTSEELARTCLDAKSGTCVLALVSSKKDVTPTALTSLSEIAHKYANAKRQIFPFYIVPDDNPASSELVQSLDLKQDIEIIAINSKRRWWRHFEGSDYSLESVENWIDTIRMGEGQKIPLPGGVVIEKTPEAEAKRFADDAPPAEPASAESVAEPTAAKEAESDTPLEAEPVAEPTAVAKETVEAEADPTAPTHNEL